jgi:quercetin dioxygenase-like cupin family protein
MKRRSFLKATAALLPTAGLANLVLAQSSTAAPNDQVHVVEAGQDRFGETRSLGFSTISFKVAPRETDGGVLIIEHSNLVKGGPPFHLHFHQEEWFYVVEGEVLFQVGDTRKRLHPGDSILGPRNVPHAFSSVGEKPGRMLIAFTPARKMEEFFRATAIPSLPKLDAEMFSKYEMKLVGPSPFQG